ncbi:hypothetical protein GHT06_021929 [Daphnia sinensis]|uniref:Uncharacterized protein n=1 Tax=Daphnia sinensis TaxID=1820382 RepID=A0AAD5PL49_9CRUS|nr:hypothetical protein GHT06_021929 [Daphnia sinensis]
MSIIHGSVHTCRDASHTHETVRSACFLLLTWILHFLIRATIRRFGHPFSALSIYWAKYHF